MLKVGRKRSYKDQGERKFAALLVAVGGWNLLARATWLLFLIIITTEAEKNICSRVKMTSSICRFTHPPLLHDCSFVHFQFLRVLLVSVLTAAQTLC